MNNEKKTLEQHLHPMALAAFAGAMFAVSLVSVAQAQSPFDVGGGLLVEPAPDAQLQAGTVQAAATAEVGGAEATETAQGVVQRPGEGRGPSFTIDLSSGLFYNDTQDEPTELYFGTQTRLTAFTQTRNQRFRLQVGSTLRVDDDTTTDLVTDPVVNFDYTLFNRSTELGVRLNFREQDVDSDFLPADFDADDLVLDPGTQEVQNLQVFLETGRDRRFGTTTRLGYNALEFIDTVDPSFNDRVLLTASNELRFSIDRRFEVTTFLSWEERDTDDAVRTLETTTRIGARADMLLDRAWTASINLAFEDEETETTLGQSTRDGFELNATVTRFMPNGRLAFAASFDELDRVSGLSATREMALAGGAALSATAGILIFENGELRPNLGLSYNHEILRGQTLTVNLAQSGTQNAANEVLYRTTLNGSYRYDLTRASSLAITGALASVQADGGASNDTVATSFGLAYRQELTRDWDFVARADTRINFTNGEESDRENRFSLNLERSFVFRP